MKKILLAIALLATVASCSKDDVTSQNQEAIGFGGPFIENTVKATDPSYSNNDIAQFNVYGTVENVVIFPGTLVEKKDASYGSAWTCAVAQYWIPGASYKFIGIVDGNKTVKVGETDQVITKTNLTNGMPTSVSYTADGVTDFMCQTITKTAKTDGTSNGLVQFSFTHLLSKVNFVVTNASTAATDYSFNVKNIKIEGYSKAEYDVVSNEWESQIPGDIVFPDFNLTKDNATKDLSTEMLLIPHDAVKVSFTVETLCKGTVITSKNYSSSTTTYELEAAKAYNFNIKVSVGEKIEFTVTGKPSWTVVTPGIDLN